MLEPVQPRCRHGAVRVGVQARHAQEHSNPGIDTQVLGHRHDLEHRQQQPQPGAMALPWSISNGYKELGGGPDLERR
jgi:hypothetical protein